MVNQDDFLSALTSLESVFTILNAVSDAICIYDTDGIIALVNDEFARLSGLDRKRIEGQDARTLFLKPDGTSVMPHEHPFTVGNEYERRRLRLPEQGASCLISAKAFSIAETGLVIVCVKTSASSKSDASQFPLTPNEKEETQVDPPTIDPISSENLSHLLSLATGKEHKHAEKVQIASEELWIELHSYNRAPSREEYKDAIRKLASVMHANIWEVSLEKIALESRALDTSNNSLLFPFTYEELKKDASHGAVRVILPQKNNDLADWLQNLSVEQTGFLVLMSPNPRQAPYDFLVLRDEEKYGPLEELEITFFKRFVQNIYRDERYANQQAQDTYISQTLQQGMGNHLREVEGLQTAALYNSATASAQVGGDFYTVMRLAPHKACIILGDVTGKGVAAASVSSALKTALVAYAWEGQAPSYIARAVNDFFMGFSRLETFATVFIGIFDTKDGTLSYCSAGHLPALILRAGSGAVEQLDVQSGVVGAFQEMIYKDGLVELFPHDKLLLYTDGMSEARNPNGVFFGEQQLMRTFEDMKELATQELPDALLQKILAYTQGRLDDDIALLVAEFNPAQ